MKHLQKWIEALESGKYEQGKKQLRSGDSFCCLGVLTDLYIRENGLDWGKWADEGLLLDEVCDWAGISTDPKHPVICGYSQVGLIEMNDSGKSFAYIAQLLREGDDSTN